MNKRIANNTSLVLLTSISCFLPSASLANPSEVYKEKSECIENPDFVTPKDKTFKYCIKSNGLVKKIDNEGILSMKFIQYKFKLIKNLAYYLFLCRIIKTTFKRRFSFEKKEATKKMKQFRI